MIGDNFCDVACNNKDNKYDGGDCKVEEKRTCLNIHIGDGICDKQCNLEKYDFDKGDCNTELPAFKETCTKSILGNGICDCACNIVKTLRFNSILLALKTQKLFLQWFTIL